MVGDGIKVEVTVPEATGVDVSEETGVVVAVAGGVPVRVGVGVPGVTPGMTALITTRMAITRVSAPMVTATRIETINAISLPAMVFHLPYLGPGIVGPLPGPNQLSSWL